MKKIGRPKGGGKGRDLLKYRKWLEKTKEKRLKACYNWREQNRDQYLENCRKLYDPVKAAAAHLKKKYNLTIEQFDEMILNQGGMCAICDQETELGVDHDHETGKVRELLCHNCNVGIGHLRDSIELIARAGEYLKTHKHPQHQV